MPTGPLPTYNIIGALMDVHADMGPGFLEKSYSEALEFALLDRSIAFRREVPITVSYRHRPLPSKYRVDFVCEGQVLVELKAQSSLGPVDSAQVIHYLKASRLPVGLLANFGEDSLVLRRFVGPTYSDNLPV